MSMTNEQIQALKAAAEKATPGRIGDRIDGSGSIKYECVGYDGSLVLKADHKNMEYGFVGDNGDADELFFRLCVPDFILSLLAAHEADKALVAELQEKQRETLRQARSFREAHDSASEIIRRYESRTIHLEPPTTRLWAAKVDCYEVKEILMAIRASCAAAGITLVVGGEDAQG